MPDGGLREATRKQKAYACLILGGIVRLTEYLLLLRKHNSCFIRAISKEASRWVAILYARLLLYVSSLMKLLNALSDYDFALAMRTRPVLKSFKSGLPPSCIIPLEGRPIVHTVLQFSELIAIVIRLIVFFAQLGSLSASDSDSLDSSHLRKF